jgi:Uncharacterized conserved protein
MAGSAEEIIRELHLEPLKGEGGFFRFISEFGDGAGMIYYLMTEKEFSHLHVLTDDEVWFFLEGDEAKQITVSPEGNVVETILSPSRRETIVKKEWYQTTFIPSPVRGWTLCATIMSPRYRQDMYKAADEAFGEKFPSLKPYLIKDRKQ